MTKPVHRKPIGENGPIRVTNTRDGPLVTWEKVALPQEKLAQETMIAKSFLSTLSAVDGQQWTLHTLPEADFDFLLQHGEQVRYLELQEIVIPAKKRGTPYTDREQAVRSVKFAETILSSLQRKSAKYLHDVGKPLELLLYVAHWRFQTNHMVHKLLALWLAQHQHPFFRVHVFEMGQSSVVQRVFPAPDLIAGFTAAMAADHRYANVDPSGFQATRQPDGSIGAGVVLSAATVKKLSRT